MSQKSYNDSPTLYLVPTPIGNLEDMTVRSINILKKVSVIFCEDTRVTGKILKEFEIKNKMIASHDHNEDQNKIKALEYLQNAKDVAIVTDRGTPIISDPGYKIVRHIIDSGFNVVSLPGATALIPALTSSGLSPAPFIFYGFLNSKEIKKQQELENLKRLDYTIIFYEAPHRIIETLKTMGEIFGNRQISISREISKKFEEVYRGTISDVIKQLTNIKGEMVLVVEGSKNQSSFDHLTIAEHVNLYIKEGNNEMEAIKLVAKDKKTVKNDIYKEYHKKKGD